MLVNDFDAKTDYETKATERVCAVCFDLLKDYIAGHSSKKFKSTKVMAV